MATGRHTVSLCYEPISRGLAPECTRTLMPDRYTSSAASMWQYWLLRRLHGSFYFTRSLAFVTVVYAPGPSASYSWHHSTITLQAQALASPTCSPLL